MKISETKRVCVKSVRIQSYSGPFFPAFALNTERQGISLRIQSECGKIWTRIIPNTDTFYAMVVSPSLLNFHEFLSYFVVIIVVGKMVVIFKTSNLILLYQNPLHIL